MVNHIETYQSILRQGVQVYEELVKLYEVGEGADAVWTDRAVTETKTKRNGLMERLTNPSKLSTNYTNTLILSIGQYLDGHWADFTTYPIADSKTNEYPATDQEKRQRLVQLHTELEDIIKEVAQLDLALR